MAMSAKDGASKFADHRELQHALEDGADPECCPPEFGAIPRGDVEYIEADSVETRETSDSKQKTGYCFCKPVAPQQSDQNKAIDMGCEPEVVPQK